MLCDCRISWIFSLIFLHTITDRSVPRSSAERTLTVRKPVETHPTPPPPHIIFTETLDQV